VRIEEVRLRNVRSYGNNTTVINLRPGLNVLLGRIGCGKTSILEAILISLFGFSKSGIKKNDVLRKNATVDALQIELTFFFDGMHFKVARGNETRLESSPDGMSWTMVSENSTEIDKFLENTLEVTARKFRDLFYAAQGELTNVITGSPEERQKSIDKLLGAEGLRETYEHLSEFTKHFDQDIGKAEGQLKDIDSYLKRFDLDEMRDKKREAEGELINPELQEGGCGEGGRGPEDRIQDRGPEEAVRHARGGREEQQGETRQLGAEGKDPRGGDPGRGRGLQETR
jgi:DNA repair exonuclease SbcCD ATPase subunit